MTTLEPRFRSRLEKWIADELTKAGVRYAFEGRRIPYTVPARQAKYLPDFEVGDNIILEGKGWFKTAADRQKLIHIKKSNPKLDIRLIFQDARKPIWSRKEKQADGGHVRKNSATTYGAWCDEHGFLWTDKRQGIPASWMFEMRPKAGLEMKRKRKV